MFHGSICLIWLKSAMEKQVTMFQKEPPLHKVPRSQRYGDIWLGRLDVAGTPVLHVGLMGYMWIIVKSTILRNLMLTKGSAVLLNYMKTCQTKAI